MEEIIPTLNEEGEEYIDTLEENTILAGVQTINGKAGDLDLKTINGQDILTPGNLALATSAQMTAETEARVAADSAEVTARTNAVNAEKTARENADTALQNAINTKQDKLIAGANIQIANDGKTISATDTTYTAGNGMKLTGTTFAVDTDAIQTKLSTTQMDAVNSGATTAKIAQIATNQGDITTINGKIPTQASTTNQLADKNFVNSSVQTATANFRGSWANWASVPTSASAYPPDYAGSTTPTVNDYLVIQDASDYTEETLDGTWRFKYTGDWDTDGKTGWLPEYQVNETPMTAAQLAAINSGITDTLVAQIGTNQSNITSLQNGKQDNLNSAQLDAVNSGIDSTKVAQIATNTGNITALQTGKQDKLTAGANVQIDQDTDTISATDTTYTAGTGLNLNGTVFSADTTVLATQADLATKADASDVYTKAEINAGTDNLGVPSGFFTDTTATVSGEGTSITLNGTGEQPLADYRIKGDASQQTYTGVNLFPTQTTNNGTSITVHNCTASFSGDQISLAATGTDAYFGQIKTAGASYEDKVGVLIPVPSGTTRIYLKQSPTGVFDKNLITFYDVNKVALAYKAISTYEGNVTVSSGAAYMSFRVGVNNSEAGETYTAGVMFATSDVNYEPYVGGIPAPNPDYPQGINVVTGTQTVRLIGKNLFHIDSLDGSTGVTRTKISNNEFESVASRSNATAYTYVTISGLTANTNYELSLEAEVESGATYTHTGAVRYSNDGGGTLSGFSDDGKITLDSGANGEVRLYFYNWHVAGDSSAKSNTVSWKNIQLELGSTATAFVPYQGQTHTIRLGSLELVKIGNYQDYIWNDGGTWKKHHVMGKYVFDNSYAGGYAKSSQSTANYSVFVANNIDQNITPIDYTNRQYSLCREFTHSTVTELQQEVGYALGTNRNNAPRYLYVSFKASEMPDLTAFTTWLGSNTITLYAPLLTATDETITDADLIADLDALYDSKTYDGQTNIDVASVSPNLPAILMVDAFKNNLAGTLAGYNEQIARLEARVADLEA